MDTRKLGSDDVIDAETLNRAAWKGVEATVVGMLAQDAGIVMANAEPVIRGALPTLAPKIRTELVYQLIADYNANADEIHINGIEYWLTGYLSLSVLEGGES